VISIQKKFLFIHVPKTGGNSLQNVLIQYSEDRIVTVADYQDGVERFEVRNEKYDITKHSPLSRYKAVLEAEVYRELFKFAVMRNPWERMISSYFSPHRGKVEWRREDFIRLTQKVEPLRYYITLEPFMARLARKLRLPAKAESKRLDRDIDFLMRFENLGEDFQKVCKRIGIPYTPLPRRNRSERSHYSHYYDEELKELVCSKFIEEIEFGGYEFGSP
jgi:hypothetical protein